ncbi:MBL fold metallo-hydrolase [Baekduia soli]|uniref:MBL fold metallo-hydrolase n=1 Tax=Baekduia soli TaxID=496014 RepID=A0A5B8U9C9_9ACTN|nr:ComEC/Rec2 family competence protein [Baekduia soli]QEC49650.1 MBL fold metallo-hydrolase [Baekduia soli]
MVDLVAASGQNVMLLTALVLAVGAVSGLGVQLRWWLTAALIALYVPLAGSGPSIQRAGIMGMATLAAALASRPASRGYALLLAAGATLAADPRSAADPGWQLSFAAVLGIALLARPAADRLRRARVPRGAAEVAAVTIAATLATAPIIAWRFDRSSLVSLPANILAAPAVAPVMWLGMIAATVGQLAPAALVAPLVAVAGLPLGFLVALAHAAAGLPGAQVAVPAAAVAGIAALVAAALLPGREGPGAASASRRRRVRRRALVVAGALAAFLVLVGPGLLRHGVVGPPPAGVLRVTALDIGQGDATLLQADGHAVLVDTGPPGAPLLAELRRAGVGRLDVLVVTHAQADHEGGAPAVLARLPVDVLLDGRGGDRSPGSRALDGPLARRHTRVVPAAAGQVVRVGTLALRVLWPPPGPAVPGTDPNDRAIVAVASAHGARVLLTADAESPVLAPLGLTPVDVLKVSHHGSADPGLEGLLQELRPRIALVEVGRHNTYGHPVPATMRALAAAGGVVRRTDRDGTVRVDLGGGRATVAAARATGGAGA